MSTVPTWVQPGTRLRFRTAISSGVGTVEGQTFLVNGVRVVRLYRVEFDDGRKVSSTNVAVHVLEEPKGKEPTP